MKRENLKLHKMGKGGVRAVIKSGHGRQIYLELDKIEDRFTTKKCFYLDRIRGGEYYTAPKKFVTTEFAQDDILNVVAKELDRKYFGVEYIEDSDKLTENEFVEKELNLMKRRYKFLIFVGEGEHVNGLPSTLTTRLANSLHRKIYFKICCEYKGWSKQGI